MILKIKRIYEDASDNDGYRILVDRLWPRGITKARAHLDEWNKNIAPSPELRKWFCHKAELFDEFSRLYSEELDKHTDELTRIINISKQQNVTLLYAAKDPEINHAVVLENKLSDMKKSL